MSFSASWLVTPPPAFTLTAHAGYVDLTFLAPLQTVTLEAADPKFWVFTSTSGYPVTATSISQPTTTVIRIYHTEGTGSSSYTLTLPVNGIIDIYGVVYNGPSSTAFNEVAIAPFLVAVQPLDARSLRVIYSEPVNSTQAMTVSNYSILPTLTITSIERETDSSYLIFTSGQTPNTVYNITVNNVTDNSNNPV